MRAPFSRKKCLEVQAASEAAEKAQQEVDTIRELFNRLEEREIERARKLDELMTSSSQNCGNEKGGHGGRGFFAALLERT
ncbi:MAG: hypothetical protein KM312_12025 [Hydrogenibacillus schlegelii]|uniref:Uncharacterized protein n=1 Tax=Hydrogenibacillus schlegelii TaxID=1484 RepID=A0A947GCP3_HYDSH|nr:hypothetical protein [Hydrogenibacillus schlegelii]